MSTGKTYISAVIKPNFHKEVVAVFKHYKDAKAEAARLNEKLRKKLYRPEDARFISTHNGYCAVKQMHLR